MSYLQYILIRFPKFSTLLIWIVSIFVILVFLLLSQYSHPGADDFCIASEVKEKGVFKFLWNFYHDWSGRYTSNTIIAVYPIIFGLFDGYFLIPIILIILLYFATTYLISVIFKIKSINKFVIISSISFISIYILGMNRTASGFYWMAGAFTYQVGNILILIFVALAIGLFDRQSKAESINKHMLLLITIIFIAIGINEIIMLVIMGAILLVIEYIFRTRTISVKPWLILFVIAVLSFCLVYFAPGNSVRSSRLSRINNFDVALLGSWDDGLSNLIAWVSNPVLITSSILSVFLISKLYTARDRDIHVTTRQLISLPIITLLSPFIFSFPVWWATGSVVPQRTFNTIYFFFILLWFATIASFTVYLIRNPDIIKFAYIRKFKDIVFVLTTFLYIYYISVNLNFTIALKDLQHNAPLYDAYLVERYKIISESLNNKILTLQIPNYKHEYPRSIYFGDITENPNDWRNVCYASYFGFKEISKKP